MKTFTKVVVITGCALFFTGLLLALVSLALGGNPKVVANRLDNMGVTHMYYNNYGWSHNYDYDYNYNFDDEVGRDALGTSPDDAAWPVLPGEPVAPDTPLTASEYEITGLDFELGAGEIEIISGDNFELIYGNDNSRRFFYERRDGDTWIIGSRNMNWHWFDSWRYGRDTLKLTVVLPRDFVAERVIISMGAGNLQVQGLAAQDITLDAGVGNCQIGNLLADLAQLSVSVGNLEVKRFHAAEATLEVGLGNMELTLSQPLSQYSCDVAVGLGSVTLGKNSYSGVAEVHRGYDNLPYKLGIDCGLGSVFVRELATVNI